MGDRGNVVIVDGSDEVYLYTHWSGYRLPTVVHTALKKRWRWDDAPYLARIIFCEMVKDDIDGETGYGISSTLGDGGDQMIYIDVDKQTVELGRHPSTTYSFEEYVGLSEVRW